MSVDCVINLEQAEAMADEYAEMVARTLLGMLMSRPDEEITKLIDKELPKVLKRARKAVEERRDATGRFGGPDIYQPL
jgi:hypothetical protein